MNGLFITKTPSVFILSLDSVCVCVCVCWCVCACAWWKIDFTHTCDAIM